MDCFYCKHNLSIKQMFSWKYIPYVPFVYDKKYVCKSVILQQVLHLQENEKIYSIFYYFNENEFKFHAFTYKNVFPNV